MTQFLRQIARHYLRNGNELEKMCFVFPGKRSMAFFRKYLSQEMNVSGRKALICPEMKTIDEFITTMSGLTVCGNVELILSLYESYLKCNGDNPGSLDDFLLWGDIILADFSDVDRYMVNPESLFANLADYKNIRDDFSYLTEQQIKALESLSLHFCSEDEPSKVKDKFLGVWNLLLPMYKDLNERLSGEGKCYPAMAHRKVAQQAKEGRIAEMLSKYYPRDEKFVFVGLNVLDECEKTILREMKKEKMAEFCWDYVSDMIKDKDNRSSDFLEDNIREFPNAFKLEACPDTPQINVMSVPSAVGQVKQLPFILGQLYGKGPGGQPAPEQEGEMNCGTECAIVLSDETLLLPTLNSIPQEVESINVTMGLQMSGSELSAMMDQFMLLQSKIRVKDGKAAFYHKPLWNIFSSPIFRKAIEADTDTQNLIEDIKMARKCYVDVDTFSGNSLLSILFRQKITDASACDAAQNKELAQYLMKVIATLAPRLASNAKSPKISDIDKEENTTPMDKNYDLQLHFAKEYYCALQSLSGYELAVRPSTYMSLIRSIVCNISVHLEGEPLKGLQIMGPLETRTLDFDNIIVISCNEGVFPRRSQSPSFIPPLLREGFGLPTHRMQDSVWAYYFYRLLQRSKVLWMLYDSRTEGVNSGEESRYIKQLDYCFGESIRRYAVTSPLAHLPEVQEVGKTDEMIDKIKNVKMSASTIQQYVGCPMEFYFSKVEGLSEEEDVDESLDVGMMGNVLHSTMENLYKPACKLYPADIEGMIKNPQKTQDIINEEIKKQLNQDEVTGRNLVFANVVFTWVQKILESDLRLARQYSYIEIIDLEKSFKFDFEGFHFKGKIDRVDKLGGDLEGKTRIVDYKTGADEEQYLDAKNWSDGTYSADRFFKWERYKEDFKKFKAPFQFYIYDKAMSGKGMDNLLNSMYQIKKISKGNIPGTEFVAEEMFDQMENGLKTVLDELIDKDVPFRYAKEEKACEHCDFKPICGKSFV